ncbi:hypothetical protein OIDMADRAFT_180825 [Oidiodendron maius Zn]|uniref:BZIP domain-containing protein n=1 Tax=Oidiodendron maius (strain Zn) TaxID=913774 RepID=A0A0C3CNS4_OIDMZ|nr:hypothetical protein OIDMADRAFT_180825 [Oidiodendron maius Zn]
MPKVVKSVEKGPYEVEIHDTSKLLEVEMGPAMDSRSSADIWFGVQDARSRKVIQDRLAQRARRKRLADSKLRLEDRQDNNMQLRIVKLAPKAPHPISKGSEEESSGIITASHSGRIQNLSSYNDIFSISERPTFRNQDQLIQLAEQNSLPVTSSSHPHPVTETHFLHMPIEGLFSALHNNSRLLGISCLFPLPRQSPMGSHELPLPLHPVPLQMEILHLPYIDCLPLPALRHNLILFSELVDDEAFCLDLMSSTSFIIVGSQSWDPSGWQASPDFKSRWPILFHC